MFEVSIEVDVSRDVAVDVLIDVVFEVSIDVAVDALIDVVFDVSIKVAVDVSIDVVFDVLIDVVFDDPIKVAVDVVLLLLLLLCPSFGRGNPPSYRGYELILSFESGKRRVARFGTYIEDVLTGGQAIPVIRLHLTSFDIS